MTIKHNNIRDLSGLLLLLPSLLFAQTLRLSPDTTAKLGGVTVADEAIAEDNLVGGITLPNIGTLPAGSNLTAYHLLPSGDQLLAFDTTVVLGGVTVATGDVVRFDGTGYTLEFDASAESVPSGSYVDAVSHDGFELLLSFDTAVVLGGTFFDDADLISFNGANFILYFDSLAAGVADNLDLDAAHVLTDTTLQLSFDISGVLGGISFDDEDVLGFDPSTMTWSLVYDGSAQHAAWSAADLDALSEGEESNSSGCTPAPDPDLNNDGIVNILDISTVGACMGRNPTTVTSCTIADTNCDGMVNFIDLTFVASGFGKTF